MKKILLTLTALSLLFSPLAFAKSGKTNQKMSKNGFQNKNQYKNQYTYKNQGQNQKNKYQKKNTNGFNYNIQTKQGSSY